MEFNYNTSLDVTENTKPDITSENAPEIKECDAEKPKRRRSSSKKKNDVATVTEFTEDESSDTEISAEVGNDESETVAVRPKTDEVTEVSTTVETNTDEIKYATGSAITPVRKIRLYKSSVTIKNDGFINSTFYVWSEKICNGRIRITNTSGGAGKISNLLGWVNVSEIK